MEKRPSSGSNDNEIYERGRHLTRDGRHREAIEVLNLAIEQNPLHAEAYFIRGACHYALGRYQQAGDDLDAAAILGCRDAQFWSKYAIHPFDKGDDDKEDG